jgi:Flp pilus assembly protein TadG
VLNRLGQIGFRLWRARRGVTAVEFGFVCVPLIGIMIATMQVATTYFSQQALETAAEKGARLLLTGQAQHAGMSAGAFKSAVCSALPTYMTCDNLLIDVDVADDFSAATTTAPTITYDAEGNPNNVFRYNTGSPNEIIVVRTMYVWGVQKGFFAFDISTMTGNRRLLMSTAVFRAENYS